MREVSDILRDFAALHQKHMSKVQLELFSQWSDIVPEPLKSHSTVLKIEPGRILLGLDHPSFTALLSLQKRSILKELKQLFPELEIKELKTKLLERIEPNKQSLYDIKNSKKTLAARELRLGNKRSRLKKTSRADFENLLEEIKNY